MNRFQRFLVALFAVATSMGLTSQTAVSGPVGGPAYQYVVVPAGNRDWSAAILPRQSRQVTTTTGCRS